MGNVSKFVAALATSLAVVTSGAGAALAANTTGGYCVKSDNGCSSAIAAGAQCGSGGGSGAYGAFGTFGYIHDFGINNLGSNGVPGADGYQTGLNNSALCGNR